MADIFSKEINEMFKEFEKQNDRVKIKKALLSGEIEDAGILFKYSCLTEDEFEEIQIEALIESREGMNDWTTGEDLARRAKDILKMKDKQEE